MATGSRGRGHHGGGTLSQLFFVCVTIVSLLTVLLPYELWLRPRLEAANLLFWVHVFVPPEPREELPAIEVLAPPARPEAPAAPGVRAAPGAPAAPGRPESPQGRPRSGPLDLGALDLKKSIEETRTAARSAGEALVGSCRGQARPRAGAGGASGGPQLLDFIAIPRTGTGWVEECSGGEGQAAHKWGNKHPELKKTLIIDAELKFQCPAAQAPPSLRPAAGPGQARQTFCVVRDPFERLISLASVPLQRGPDCTAETLNKKVLNFLLTAEGHQDGKPKPYNANCALLPQAAFVYGWSPSDYTVDTSQRSCTHVLRYDNLAEDFDVLMEAKGYPYRLGGSAQLEAQVRGEKGCLSELTAADFKPQTRDLVYAHFRDDFRMLGLPTAGGAPADGALRSLCPGQTEPAAARSGARLQPLSFIHIPRTAGTVISGCSQDEVADEQRWGTHSNALSKNIMANLQEKFPERCWGYHAPPSMQRRLFEKQDGFCVVRDPYERLISELELHYAQSPPKGKQPCDPESLNRRMVQLLMDFKGAHSRTSPKPYSRNCHLLPQAAYIYGWDQSKNRVDRSRKFCTHVLRHERLAADFNELMEGRGYPYRLGSGTPPRPPRTCTTGFGPDDLWPEVLALVEEIYKDDFELLGFQVRRASGRDPNRRIGVCKDQERAPPPWPAGQKPVSPVTLIHIPRTGGTSVEECTVNEIYSEYTWGNQAGGLHFKKTFPGMGQFCWGQHVPPNLGMSFYDGKETFCVVRNPYDRMISEYGFRQEFFGPPGGKLCDPGSLDEHIIKSLKQVLGHGYSRRSPYMHDCHLLPQSAFVYGWDLEKERVDRTLKNCHVVLRYERIAEDFNSLMEERGYPYRLVDHKKVTNTSLKKAMKSPKACANMTRSVLTPAARRLMAEVWKDDFELFGYDPDK